MHVLYNNVKNSIVNILYYSDCAATNPDNGEVTATTAIHGDTVTFSCNAGFIIQGTATATCDDGTLTAASCVEGNAIYIISNKKTIDASVKLIKPKLT